MKRIIIIPDGVPDHAYRELDGRTPLEAARTPNLDALAQMGKIGQITTIPMDMEPGTDVGCLSIFGLDPRHYYTGRAPLEAIGMGIDLAKDEIAFRFNLVTLSDGMIFDHSAGHISTAEAHVMIQLLNDRLATKTIRLYPGVSYRHIAVIKTDDPEKWLSVRSAPPYDLYGRKVAEHWPQGAEGDILKDFCLQAADLLAEHEINQVRIDLGENPANFIWFWGQGNRPEIQSFTERFRIQGLVLGAVDMVRGVGRAVGLDAAIPEGATGNLETNYANKGVAMIEALKKYDFVTVHVEAADEASHHGDVKAKINAIEEIDRHIVGPALRYLKENPDTRIAVIPDHPASCVTRSHVRGPVPFLVAGKRIDPDEFSGYNETQAKASDWKITEGHTWIDAFMKKGD